jgi:hypothetical protein
MVVNEQLSFLVRAHDLAAAIKDGMEKRVA